MVDARAFSAIFLFLIHARLWTFALAAMVMFIFWVFERRGLTFEAACRALRCWILGRRRPASLAKHRRHWIDFG
ncbi:MAG: IcmT/TraK family protein [Alphaproteobacteria bacterium]|nr:IcmT/TraK family protein [Alphaproteobacteria bacterium]